MEGNSDEISSRSHSKELKIIPSSPPRKSNTTKLSENALHVIYQVNRENSIRRNQISSIS